MAKLNAATLLDNVRWVERSGRLGLVQWAVVIGSLLMTLGVWYVAKTQIETQNRERFDHQATHLVELISERMRNYEDALWSGVSTLQTRENGLNHEEWKTFAGTLHLAEKYPGINGIGVAYRVLPQDLNGFLQRQQETRPYFTIHPPHKGDDLLPITFIEPVEKNAEAVGLDLAHETDRYAAAVKARNTGTAQISGPITLVQDAGKTPGFQFFAPFYRNPAATGLWMADRRENFAGLVLAPVIMSDLMQGVWPRHKRQVRVSITDGNELLYNEHNADEGDYDQQPLFSRTVQTEMYGRPWAIDIRSTLSFRALADNKQPTLILLGGVLVNSLLLTLFFLVAKTNRRALGLAREMSGKYSIEAADAEEQRKRLAAIFDATVDGLITIDEDGLIESFNPACEKFFGYEAHEVTGKDVKLLMPENCSHRNDGTTECDQTCQNQFTCSECEMDGIRKDGTTFPLELSVSAIHLDGRRLYSGTVRDITARKQMEIMKDDFISTVNHELRTPLTSIRGSLGLLMATADEKLDAKAKRLLQLAHDNCRRLNNLVNDILDLQQIAAGRMSYALEEVEICQLTRDIIARNRGYADEHETAFVLKADVPEAYCNIDPNRFDQALSNLLSNAAKFSPQGEVVTVVIAREDGNRIRVSVEDKGPGIPEEFRSKIFGKFVQVDSSSTRAQGGNGLGLNIAKSIIDAFGGAVSFDTEEGKGTTFHFVLPTSS